jgi:Ricin-type beta-trefoil lectin domain
MGVDRSSREPDANIGQHYCEGAPDQTWITAGGGNSIRIMNYNSRLCIGVDRASTARGAQVKQFHCDDKPNQKWVPIFTEV